MNINDTFVRKNEPLHELVAATIVKLVEARIELEHERFSRRLFMYGFYAVAILDVVSSLCYFL